MAVTIIGNQEKWGEWRSLKQLCHRRQLANNYSVLLDDNGFR